ncbi:splicing factor, suppressor of white-apricot homolog isoform X1 [Brassica napus]|uniref:splicing factor, suppressor of white-apricot homolog isoform X1 n=1 Tax=Brassica napus TaxID=3708 RepID=UPI0006AA73F8|nr:splicing factor, suppressor of white-apricot homolog isoform X1 [Brassica napus]
MDLEIVGRHALFFDDDSMATFVNSPTALVDWNSLFIDRYDVRHLLSSLPPPRPKRRRPVSDDPNLDADLDHERYLDLPADSPSPPHDESDANDGSASTNAAGFRAVPYSYGSSSDFSDQKIADTESGFNPPFPVPDYLLQHLPPTEKLHQIMARTSSFVSKHGGQSEIVLRVKQGGNPTFGFLMPDHHLHPYFRFLVEHQELLTGKSAVEDKNIEGGKDGGALSLLGSVYGTVEDDDTNEESARDCKTKGSPEGDGADSSGPEVSKEAAKIATVRDVASKHSLPSNDQAPFIKGNPSVSAVNVVERKQINTEDKVSEKPLASEKLQSCTMLGQPKLELQIVEPPVEMKRAIDKIVDFIQKNGKELEATLAAQDVKYGMFPFLRPASLYHGYYRKVLQEAEELRSCNRGDFTKKEDMKQEKMDSTVKDGKPALGSGSVLQDDSAKREKQKMVSDKPKIELKKEPFKPVEPQMRVNVDVNTAAAILEAARRGIRNPQLGILSGKPLDGTSQSLGNDGSNTSSKHPDLAKSMGQLNSGSAAASEADSSEAGLSKEQKLKAERLKRAKMFVAMLKPGAQAAQQAEPSRSLSVEPFVSGSGSNAAKEVEGGSYPSEVSEKKQADDGNTERRSKRNYRSRSQRDEDDEIGEEEDNEESSMEEVTEDTKTEKKHSSRKRHDSHKNKKRHSSKDTHSRDKHNHESSSDDEYHSRSRHRHKHSKSLDRHELYDSSDTDREHRYRSSKHNKDADYSKDKRSYRHKSRRHHDKHIDSSDDEHRRHHRHRSSRRKHEDSSDGEHGHRQKSSKRIKKDEKRVEEESVSKSDQSDRKASPEDNIMHPQSEPTQVSDELRAKIRAMLADTL